VGQIDDGLDYPVVSVAEHGFDEGKSILSSENGIFRNWMSDE
jgi:hypothetical protein